MTKRDRRKASARANAKRRGEAKVGKTATPQPEQVVKLHRKSGLEWLLSKKRITALMFRDGQRYGADWRNAGIIGLEPLRSCLDTNGSHGAAGPREAFTKAEHNAAALDRLESARRALSNHQGMIAACDLICGQQLTPREINPVQREADKIEHALVIALGILAKHYSLTVELKSA